ncbi:hypothetical protein D3C80_2124520 [compost metagenome]
MSNNAADIASGILLSGDSISIVFRASGMNTRRISAMYTTGINRNHLNRFNGMDTPGGRRLCKFVPMV